MPYPQKLVLTDLMREVFLHRLEHLEQLDADDMADLFYDEDAEDQLDPVQLCEAAILFAAQFRASNGKLVAVHIQNVVQAEILAEALEGCTFFGNYQKGDAVYRHAAKSAAELLSTVLDREVVAYIDPVPQHAGR